MGKKIVILNGSPRKKGNTSALVKSFTEGAESAGNTVTEFSFPVWISMAAKDVLADTAAKPVPVYRKMTWIRFIRR